ncbi:TPA: hypothetical protein DD394_08800 [bacterium UBP9_UBA11836]|nr:hypothetical protein [bacterium UBP9_UBA11836]
MSKLKKLFKTINEFLKENTQEFHFDEESGVFSFKEQITEEKRSAIDISFFISDCSVTLHAISALKIPQSKVASLSEFIVRANNDIEIGNFDLDLAAEHPIVSFKVNILLDLDMKIDEDDLDLAVQIVLGTMRSYWIGFTGVLDEGLSAVEALDSCYEEEDDEDRDDCCCGCHDHEDDEDYDDDDEFFEVDLRTNHHHKCGCGCEDCDDECDEDEDEEEEFFEILDDSEAPEEEDNEPKK